MSTSVKDPKYALHKATGQARVRFNGKSIYLGVYGTPESRRRYDEFLAAIPRPEEPLTVPDPVPGDRLTVGHLVLVYFNQHVLTYYRKNDQPTSEVSVIRALVRPLVKQFGDLPADQFGPLKLEMVRNDMIARGWARDTVNRGANIIRRCFRWGASRELIPGGVVHALEALDGLKQGRSEARETTPVRPVADAHIDAVLPMVSDLVSDICRLMRLTGMRPGEVLAMTMEELDRTDPSCWVYSPRSHKTLHHGHTRTVLIGARAQEILSPRLIASRVTALREGKPGPLFPMTRAALRRSIHRGCKRAGIPNWHPNQIRHTVGTEVRSKYGLEAAQIILGHKYADVTQTYAERDIAKAAEIVRRLG